MSSVLFDFGTPAHGMVLPVSREDLPSQLNPSDSSRGAVILSPGMLTLKKVIQWSGVRTPASICMGIKRDKPEASYRPCPSGKG